MGELAQFHFKITGGKSSSVELKGFSTTVPKQQPVLYIYSSVKSFCCIFWLDHSSQVNSLEAVFLSSLHHHALLSFSPSPSFHHFLSHIHQALWNLFFLLTIHLNLILVLLVILVDLCMFISPLLPLFFFFFYSHSHGHIDRASGLLCATLFRFIIFFLSFTPTLSSHSLPLSYIFFPITPPASPPPSPFLHRPMADSISGNVVYEKAFHFPKPFVFKTLQGLSCFISLSDAAVSLNRNQNLQLNICWCTQQHHTKTHTPTQKYKSARTFSIWQEKWYIIKTI